MQTTFSSTKRSSSISINFIVPQGWHELSDKQLRYVYQLLADDFATDEIKTLCLLQWTGTKVIGRQDSGVYLLKKAKILFEVTPLTLAELLPHLEWHGAKYSARSSRSAFVRKKPRRHRQSQRSQAQALVLAQVLRLGNEHSGILRRLPRPGVLPGSFQRPQSRHHAPRRYAIKTSIVASNLLRS